MALGQQRAACLTPEPAQRAVLDDLVSQATGTAFDREHGVAGIRTIEDWRAAVPIRPYHAYRPWIDRVIAGEQSVLTTDEPYALLTTSGTSGDPKLIPTTRYWRQHYRGPALYAQWGLYFQLLGLETVAPNTALDLSWDRTARPGRVGELPVYGITQRQYSLGGNDWTPPWYGAPWFADTVPGEDRMYTQLCWLADQDVRLVVAVNPSKLVRLAEQLADRTDDLIRDVHDGTIGRRRVPQLRARPEAARRLAARAAARGGPLQMEDAFPALSLLVCWMSGSARLYEPWLRRMAPGAAILPFSTTGTEGIVTLPIDNHLTAGPLAINQALYEFTEISDIEDESIGASLAPEEVEVGKAYRLIMSQANGMYRYDTGDAYQVVGWAGRTPRLEFLGRVGHTTSFTGEKLTENQIHLAVRRSWGTPGRPLPLFTSVPIWEMPPRYLLMIEGLPPDTDARTFAREVEESLCALNGEYADKRSGGRLAPIDVHVLSEGSFAAVTQARLTAGAAAAQIKHHWLQRDASVVEALRSLGRLGGPALVLSQRASGLSGAPGSAGSSVMQGVPR